MKTYTIEFTRLGSEKNFQKTIEANTFKEAANEAERTFLRRCFALKIWEGGICESSKLTNAFAEELLYEMDAKGINEIEIREAHNLIKKYTREEVELALFDKSGITKHRFKKALDGALDGN